MDRILYIVGPTATGKTELALDLADKFNGDIISADSRQVYRDMTIGSGKDIPQNAVINTITLGSETHTTYQSNQTTIWGYDCISPDQDWSIAQFHHFAHSVIEHIHAQHKLPIIVGGTGFYLKSIQSPPNSIKIPPNLELRRELSTLSLDQLQSKLKAINADRFNQLNQSDRGNPRRLIRRIEIELSKKTNQTNTAQINKVKFEDLWLGLDAPTEVIDQKITQRVFTRLEQGFDKEVRQLIAIHKLKSGTSASSTTGYRQWLEYVNGEKSQDEAIERWIIAEKQYARRQKTWFKKQSHIHWFDISMSNQVNSVVDLVKTWYANPI